MHSERELLERDLYTLETMISHLPEYLTSDDTYWEIYESHMPKLTVGGCLMRQQRLTQLRHRLPPILQERLQTATQKMGYLMNQNIVRFEQKTHQELHARLSEWMKCLGNLSRLTEDEGCFYADKVDARVVITDMIDQMQQAPFRLEQQVLTELRTLDNNLRQRWEDGEFIWLSIWEEAYPSETYWYLHGKPQIGVV